jgi:hypothetical protein
LISALFLRWGLCWVWIGEAFSFALIVCELGDCPSDVASGCKKSARGYEFRTLGRMVGAIALGVEFRFLSKVLRKLKLAKMAIFSM